MNKYKNNIIDYFTNAANLFPNKTAIIYKNESVSFYDLEKNIHLTAIHFQQKGIKQGDKVMVFVPMSIDLYRILLALFKIGATAVFLDEWVSKERMEQSCKLAKVDACISTIKAMIFSFFSKELRKIPIKLTTNYNKNTIVSFKETIVDSSETALITFTTGSSGIPKAAIRSHKILSAQFLALKEIISPSENDIDLCALPIVLLINLGAGCTSVIANYNSRKPKSLKVDLIITQIRKHKTNRIVGSPFLLKQLALFCTTNNITLPVIKKLFTGGATVFVNDAKIIHSAFIDAEAQVVYGSTEAEPISAISIMDLINSNNLVPQIGINTGKIHTCAKVKLLKIMDDGVSFKSEKELDENCVPKNCIGEIIVSGQHVVQQYLHNQEAVERTKIFIEDTCWHRTGDSGYITDDGNLYFTGRCSTLIHKNDKIISTVYYENILQQIEGVSIATILYVNKKIIACIEIKSNADKQYIKNSIADENIYELYFIKKIPRDPRHFSKIDYEKLQEIYLKNK